MCLHFVSSAKSIITMFGMNIFKVPADERDILIFVGNASPMNTSNPLCHTDCSPPRFASFQLDASRSRMLFFMPVVVQYIMPTAFGSAAAHPGVTLKPPNRPAFLSFTPVRAPEMIFRCLAIFSCRFSSKFLLFHGLVPPAPQYCHPWKFMSSPAGGL